MILHQEWRLRKPAGDCTLWLCGGRQARFIYKRILCRAAKMQHQLHDTVKTFEQGLRKKCIAIGPPEVAIRLKGMEFVSQGGVGCLHFLKLSSLANYDAPQSDTQHARIACHTQFRRDGDARHNPHDRRAVCEGEDVDRAILPRCLQAGAINQQVQPGVVRQRKTRARATAIKQVPPHAIDQWSAGRNWSEWALRRESPPRVRILEQPPIAVISVGLGRCAVGQQDVVGLKLDMEEGDLLGMVVPKNRSVIDQKLYGDKRAIDVERMGLGHFQVTVRHVGGQRALPDDHRGRRTAPPAGDQNFSSADPDNFPGLAAKGLYEVTCREPLNRHFTRRRSNQRFDKEAKRLEICSAQFEHSPTCGAGGQRPKRVAGAISNHAGFGGDARHKIGESGEGRGRGRVAAGVLGYLKHRARAAFGTSFVRRTKNAACSVQEKMPFRVNANRQGMILKLTRGVNALAYPIPVLAISKTAPPPFFSSIPPEQVTIGVDAEAWRSRVLDGIYDKLSARMKKQIRHLRAVDAPC